MISPFTLFASFILGLILAILVLNYEYIRFVIEDYNERIRLNKGLKKHHLITRSKRKKNN